MDWIGLDWIGLDWIGSDRILIVFILDIFSDMDKNRYPCEASECFEKFSDVYARRKHMIRVHGITPERRRPGEAIQDTFLHRLPIPLEYDPVALERDREYWESVGFNFKPLPPKGRKSKNLFCKKTLIKFPSQDTFPDFPVQQCMLICQ